MANEQDKNPTTGTESDISKAKSQQQPPNQASQQQGGTEQTGDQAATGQTQSGSAPDEGLQGDTLAQQRTDIEGGSQASKASEGQSGFVGAEGQQDTSSELVEDEDEEFAKDGQGAPEGK